MVELRGETDEREGERGTTRFAESKAEAVEWAKKVPLGDGGFVEVRPIWPM